MTRIPMVAVDDAPPEVRAVFDRFAGQRNGVVPNLFRTLANLPKVMTTIAQHHFALHGEGSLPRETKLLVTAIVSKTNDCTYCMASDEARAQQYGISHELVQALLDFEHHPGFTPAQRIALRFARQMTVDAHRISDEAFAELGEHYDPGQVLELVCAVGLANYLNRVSTALQIDVSG